MYTYKTIVNYKCVEVNLFPVLQYHFQFAPRLKQDPLHKRNHQHDLLHFHRHQRTLCDDNIVSFIIVGTECSAVQAVQKAHVAAIFICLMVRLLSSPQDIRLCPTVSPALAAVSERPSD
ncbi:hypothetical protein WA026_015031 [Henosepilachna vigintioctopunctata]|uniref:Uncharacterized protein n=1 Tax=Henosepilachna vigintioctopunctata TaxID=420089 RepID=A0AAW1U705_9CUCU